MTARYQDDGEDRATARINIRTTDEIKETIRENAEAEGTTMTALMLERALERRGR